MSETPTQRELLTAHERRAQIIRQLHANMIATADDWSARRRAKKEGVEKKAGHSRAVPWLFGAGTVFWILAVGYFITHWP